MGNFVNNEAFSAVGTIGSIVNLLIGFFMGFSSGAGVLISQYYGAHQEDKVNDAVHTAIVMTPYLLRLMDMPQEVMPDATIYLTVYFSGIFGLMLYNIGAGILRAVGDSQRPFYFLVVCAILNTALDLLFVLKLGMGVEGVALATILSPGTSAILIIITLQRADSCIQLHPSRHLLSQG